MSRQSDIWSGCRESRFVILHCGEPTSNPRKVSYNCFYWLVAGRELKIAVILRNLKIFLRTGKKLPSILTHKRRGCWWKSSDAHPFLRLCAYPHLSFSSAYNESSIIRSSSCSADAPAKFLSTSSLT